MYLTEHLESQVKQILEDSRRNSILKCLLRPLVEKYHRGKEINREIRTGMDIIRLAKGKESSKELLKIAVQLFNRMTEEEQKELLLSLMKEEISKVIFNDITFNLNDTTVEIKFHHGTEEDVWRKSFEKSGFLAKPISVFSGKDAVYIDLLREESCEKNSESGSETTLESYYLKMVEVEIQPGRYLSGLIFFSSISTVSSGFQGRKAKRTHLLKQYELILPVRSRALRIGIWKVSRIYPGLSKEYAGFCVKNYLTHEEFTGLFKDRPLVDLFSENKLSFSKFQKILQELDQEQQEDPEKRKGKIFTQLKFNM